MVNEVMKLPGRESRVTREAPWTEDSRTFQAGGVRDKGNKNFLKS